MVVEGDVFKFEVFLISILVDECGIQLTLAPRTEALDFDLLGEVDRVC